LDLSYCQGGLLIKKYVKKLDFVKMSGELDDGDNPPHHFSPTIYHHCFPLSTTTIGPVDSKNSKKSPL
jgi:hypothetical protein